jgi:hypothetical protein
MAALINTARAEFAPDNLLVLIASHDGGLVAELDLERRAISGWFEVGSGIEMISCH